MDIYSIYKATNKINGKTYIGFTTNPKARFLSHKYLANQNLNIKFYNAINKYGYDNFQFEIVYQSKDMDHCKNVMETHFILEYDSMNNGYNMKLGGDGTPGLVPWNKGKKIGPHTEEYKKKMSQSCKGINTGPRPKYVSDRIKEAFSIKLECPHCGGSFQQGHLTRWHGDKCKLKPIPQTV